MATKKRDSRISAGMLPQKIKALREQAHVSQAVFAAVLNTSVSTVQKWEVGDKKPSEQVKWRWLITTRRRDDMRNTEYKNLQTTYDLAQAEKRRRAA